VYGSGLLGNLKVGLMKELVKGALIVLFALGIRSHTTRDGMVLGATVGFGFAALESSGSTRWHPSLSSRVTSSSCRYLRWC